MSVSLAQPQSLHLLFISLSPSLSPLPAPGALTPSCSLSLFLLVCLPLSLHYLPSSPPTVTSPPRLSLSQRERVLPLHRKITVHSSKTIYPHPGLSPFTTFTQCFILGYKASCISQLLTDGIKKKLPLWQVIPLMSNSGFFVSSFEVSGRGHC